MPKKSSKDAPPPGTFYEDGQLRDIRTNEKVLFSTHCCSVFRETLPQGSEPSQMEAMRVMERTYKKRQAHATLNILDDRFTIVKNKKSGKEPFRPWLSYKEVTDFQQSLSKPDFCVLTVNSAISNKYYYEVYKCKSKEDVKKFEDYVRHARSRPSFTVSGKGQESLDNAELKPRSIVEYQQSDESLSRSPVYDATSPTFPRGYTLYSPPANVNTNQSNYRIPSPKPTRVVQTARSPPPTSRRITIVRSNSYEKRLTMTQYSPPVTKHTSLQRFSPPAGQYLPVQQYEAPVVRYSAPQRNPLAQQYSPQAVRRSPPMVRYSSPESYSPPIVRYSSPQRNPPLVRYSSPQQYAPPMVNPYRGSGNPVKPAFDDTDQRPNMINGSPRYIYSPDNQDVGFLSESPVYHY